MKNTLIIPVTFISLLFVFMGCKTIHTHRMPDFQLKESYYQSWVVSPQNKGTDIVLKLKYINPNIKFKSIIFRGREVPVQSFIQRNKIVLKAAFTSSTAKLKSKIKINRKSNRLTYQIGNREYYMLLNNLKRKKTKYSKIR